MKAKLQQFEGLLASLGQALHPGEQGGQSIGLAGAAAATKSGLAAANGPRSAAEGIHEAAGPMSQPRPHRAAAGDQDPQTHYSGIQSIRDSTGGWRWIVTAADTGGKARSFPVDAGKPHCQTK